MSETARKCLGFPDGYKCDNLAGCRHSPYWCEECNERRLKHLDKRFAEIAAKLDKLQHHT